MDSEEDKEKFQVSKFKNKSNTFSNHEFFCIIGLISELGSFFTKMHGRCETIETYLITLNNEIQSERNKSIQPESRFEQKKHPSTEAKLQVEPNTIKNSLPRPQVQQKMNSNIEITPNIQPKQILIPKPIKQEFSESEESIDSDVSQIEDLSEIRKGNVLNYFIDDSKHAIKEMKTKLSESTPRRVPKLAYFKLKLLRFYAKSIKLITRPRKTTKESPDDLLCLNVEIFTRNTTRNKEKIEDIIEQIKGNSKTNDWYTGLFERNQARTDNFKIFVENLFEKDIKNLIKKFGFKCCLNLQHKDFCKNKWRLLRDWIFKNITGFNY